MKPFRYIYYIQYLVNIFVSRRILQIYVTLTTHTRTQAYSDNNNTALFIGSAVNSTEKLFEHLAAQRSIRFM